MNKPHIHTSVNPKVTETSSDVSPSGPSAGKFRPSKSTTLLTLLVATALLTVIAVNVLLPQHNPQAFNSVTVVSSSVEPKSFEPSTTTESGLSAESLEILRANSFVARGRKLARRVVIITAATHHYLDFIRNLRCSVRTSTGKEVVLFALDRNVSEAAKAMGMPTLDTSYEQIAEQTEEGREKEKNKPFKFATPRFNAITKLKLRAFRDALLSGVDVLFTDVDVVWCDDAATRLVQQLEEENAADVLIQNGRPSDTFWPVDANTGFFYARANQNVLDLFEHLGKRAADPLTRADFDQSLFKHEVCLSKGSEEAKKKGVRGYSLKNSETGRMGHVCQWDKRVLVEILPLRTYPNGHSPLNKAFRRLRRGELRKACVTKEIVVFHNNWCSGQEKNERMDSQRLWAMDKSKKTCLALA